MALRFDILLGVRSSPTSSRVLGAGMLAAVLAGAAFAWSVPRQSGGGSNPTPKAAQAAANATPAQSPTSAALSAAHSGLNIVVLDPAHGGTDPGARGTEGITES